MRIRLIRSLAFALISLLSFFSLTAQTGTQESISKWLGGPPRLRQRTERSRATSAAQSASGYTYDILYSFCSAPNCGDGSTPQAGLIQDTAGNLYATTAAGGANANPSCGANGCGTVFRLDNTGQETVLYSFCSAPNCADGANPQAGLIQDAAGNLYGTTAVGGLNSNQNCSNGCGTVFKVDNTGHETVLYSFCSITVGGSPCLDGNSPQAGLIQDVAGSFYGTTSNGGEANGGTVFKLDNAGSETVLYNFCEVSGNCPDGTKPKGSLIEDAAGNFYGTTSSGGNSFYTVGLGTVFKLGNAAHEVLYSFCIASNCPDGSDPEAALIRDTAGNLYGTTATGGGGGVAGGFGDGTVFKVDTTTHHTILYSFCSAANCADGAIPQAGLIQDTAGNLYSTTAAGGANVNPSCGANGCGTVFRLDNTGQETVLYSFCSAPNCMDGAVPQAGLIEDAAGNLYGTTSVGGGNGAGGAVFKITPPSFVITGTSVNVSPGGTTVSTITVTPRANFTGSVALTATITSSPTGAQDLPMLSFGSTSPVTLTGTSAGTATLTIATTAATRAALAYPGRPAVGMYSAVGVGMTFIMLIGMQVLRRSKKTKPGILFLLLLIVSDGFIACGGGSSGGSGSPGTTPGVYTVTVTGTSGSATSAAAVSLTVQ